MGFLCFFYEGSKFTHLDLGKPKISKKHVGELFIVQSSGGEPSPNGIELDPLRLGKSHEVPNPLPRV
jgi:hypothetical protein